jgi:hypothetical protein
MTKIRVVVALVAGVTVFSPSLHGQSHSTPKPSPYSGVSQPPPDDTITAEDPAGTTNPPAVPAAGLVIRPASPAVPVVTAVAPPPSAVPTQPTSNPDYYMIGDAPNGLAPVPASTGLASSANPDADVVTSVPHRPGELPEGTSIRMLLNQELSTTESQPGSDFSGRVAGDVIFSGRVVIPQGSEVMGKVLRVTEGHRFGSPATIRLRPDLVVLPDGSRYVMRAQVIDADGKSRVDGEGTLKPKSQLKNNTIKEGAGVGTGAVAGAIIGGPPGALVGSVVGASVMTTHILVQHPSSVKVPKNSLLTLSLTQPMSITPAQND